MSSAPSRADGLQWSRRSGRGVLCAAFTISTRAYVARGTALLGKLGVTPFLAGIVNMDEVRPSGRLG